MKNKIIILLLTMLGLGGCCNKPHKSRTPKDGPIHTEQDSVISPIRLMYGVPYKTFEIRGELAPSDSTAAQKQ